MIRLACSVSLLSLVGCGGSIVLEDVEPFGRTASAVWIHYEDTLRDSIVLTNVGNACQKLQNYAEAKKDLDHLLANLDVSSYCEDAEEEAIAAARAANALWHDGANILTIDVFADESSEPKEETYDVGDDEPRLSASMVYWKSSPYQAVPRHWDPTDELEDNCGVDDDYTHVMRDSWKLTKGEFDVEEIEKGEWVQGRLEGQLRDEDDDKAGDIEVSFTADWCPVEG